MAKNKKLIGGNKMKISEKYNKGGLRFTYQMPENVNFYKLEEVYKNNEIVKPCICNGFYISKKGQYGEQAVVLSDGFFVNLPKHWVDTIKEMLTDKEVIKAVNEKKVYFDIEKYQKDGKDLYSIVWIDLD